MKNQEIKATYDYLNQELRDALSTMERSDKIIEIRKAIKELQNICPHTGNYELNQKCPYCGKKFGE